MKEGWKEYSLVEIATIKSGKRLPKGHELSNIPSPYPYIKARDIKQGKVNSKGLEFLDKQTRKKIAKYIVLENDILITIVANIGDVGIVPQNLNNVNLTENAVRLTNLKQFVDARYLTYMLSQRDHKEYMESLAAGAAQAKLGIYKIEKIKVSLPSIGIQKRIASILSAYDDLIEVNNQRIELLEQSARELYKEWFVRMRFPNYQNTKFKKGIPEGWDVKKIEDISNSQYGYTASSDDVGDAKFLRITDIVDNLINWEKVPFCSISQNNISKYSLKYGDILIARTGATVGYAKRINKGHPLSVFASYLVRLQLKDIDLNYFLGIIVDSEQYKEFIQTVASGAAQPNANASMITSYSVLIPNKPLIIKFNNQISIIFDQIENLQKQNQELAQIRNRLLPRLISGKLKVKA